VPNAPLDRGWRPPKFKTHLNCGRTKQRNKHIQRALVEAAKLAPRQDHQLALAHEKEKEKGHANRATLAVARKMVAYLVAVDRAKRDFVAKEDLNQAMA
jgi:hypothetical protein